MYKIINYVNVVSDALLAIVDNYYDEFVMDSNGKYYIPLNKIKKELLLYIDSNIRNECRLGHWNILINTCRPYDNWRKIERGKAIKACKYRLSDTFVIDNQKLENLLDKIYLKQSQKNNIILLSITEIDIFDIECLLGQILKENISITKSGYYMLEDKNLEYLHTNNKFPLWIEEEAIQKLKQLKQL